MEGGGVVDKVSPPSHVALGHKRESMVRWSGDARSFGALVPKVERRERVY